MDKRFVNSVIDEISATTIPKNLREFIIKSLKQDDWSASTKLGYLLKDMPMVPNGYRSLRSPRIASRFAISIVLYEAFNVDARRVGHINDAVCEAFATVHEDIDIVHGGVMLGSVLRNSPTYCVKESLIDELTATDFSGDMTIKDLTFSLPHAVFLQPLSRGDGGMLSYSDWDSSADDNDRSTLFAPYNPMMEITPCSIIPNNFPLRDTPEEVQMAVKLSCAITDEDTRDVIPFKLTKAMRKNGGARPSKCRWLGRIRKRYIEAHNHGGSHASPRMHWRRGHIRNQKTKNGYKTIWIQPMLINKEAS